MTWTNLGGRSPGDVVKAEMWNQMYANFEAMGDGDSGAPSVSVESALASSGTAGGILSVAAGGAIVTDGVVVPVLTVGNVVGSDTSPGSVTIPVTLPTSAGTFVRWSIVRSVFSDTGNTLYHASGVA